MTFKNDDYYDIHDMLKDFSFYVFVGSRANKVSKIRYGISYLLEYLFGGECVYDYDVACQIHKYKLRNDDIGYYEFNVTNEAFIYEIFDVRITRMCEEYDAYMRYKFRDYKE